MNAATEVPLAGDVPGESRFGLWPPARYMPALGGRDAGARRRANRWRATLPDAQKHKLDGRWLVCGDAVLPNGQTVEQYGQVVPLGAVPVAVTAGSAKTRGRHLSALQVAQIDREFQREHPGLGPTTVAYFAELERVVGSRIRELKCSPKRSAMLTLRKRLARGEVVDKRSIASRRKRSSTMDKGLYALAVEAYLSENRPDLTEVLRWVNGEAAKQGKAPLSYDAVRRRMNREVGHRERVRYREGPKAFEARCVPKIERSYDMAAGEWWCLDGRVLDIMCRVPDGRREWRRARLVVMGVSDMRSRSLSLEVAATENSDAILAGIKRACLGWGVPSHVILDNGQAYKSAAGTPRGTKRQRGYLKDGRVGSAFAQLGVETHYALPYRSWAKPIESLWNKLKRGFDKWFWSYWGGSPGERPESADRRTKQRIDELPTLDDIREALDIWLDEYHASEQSGAGTLGLSPNLVMEQYQGAVRRVDADVLSLLCCRVVGPVKVKENGVVRWANTLYGQADHDMLKLAGRQVWLRINPGRTDRVAVCDENGVPVCYANNRRLTDATQEDRREAAKVQARARRIAREYPAARDVLLDTPTTGILKAKRDRAQAAEDEQRKQLPAAEAPDVTIVRPDLVEPAKKLEQRAAVVSAASGRVVTDDDLADGFERLAQAGDVPTYETAQDGDGLLTQDADEDVFDCLADVG